MYEEVGTAIGKPKQEIVDTIVEHIGQKFDFFGKQEISLLMNE